MSETVEGYPGVLCHMDDVLVFGVSQEEHDERLERILEAIGKAGLTLNEKCEFSKPSVKFLGQIVDASGCKVNPDKVKAIAEMAKPTDISGVRRFLGMVNQLNKFSCKVTELTKPLRELLKTHNAWHWGKKFNLETDHKPLVPLLSSKGIAKLPPRIQRFRMRLLRFDFTIEHVPGKELNISDALSRSPVDILSESNEFETETKAYVDSIVNNFPASDMRLQNIKRVQGWPEKSSLSNSLKPYWSLQGEFTIAGNMLLKADRLVIPRSLQDEILERLHDGHQGIVKCRERAKSSVWWLGMSTIIENMVKRCQKCIENANDHAEPLLQPEFPKRPWQKLASDLFELKGQTYLLVVDYFSRYIKIAKLSSTSSQSVVNHLKSIFARHGIPETFISDGGPQYSSFTFKQFAQSYGFRHIMSSPRFAQSKGLAERSVQTIKNMLKKSDDEYNSLLSYRTTPLANGYSPAELLMGRKLRTLVPVAPKNLAPKLPNTRELSSERKMNINLNKNSIMTDDTERDHFLK
ncbi:unnamed protein product [Mytilus coruscus]|uniref:Integrase catalytic domain-containing protein n=1 Tax=Mytilus coruscus TaxID=42192 RepID=A0A6J8DLE8_MYTCO|nr:unnamed protein product [Mytilus coruscus]